MFILKNIALFLSGIFLLVWGFWINMNKKETEAPPKEDKTIVETPVKEENPVSESTPAQKAAPAVSPAAAAARTPKQTAAAKKRRSNRITLEKKKPEKAKGSQ